MQTKVARDDGSSDGILTAHLGNLDWVSDTSFGLCPGTNKGIWGMNW